MPAIVAIPIFFLFKNLGLLDTVWALMLIYAAMNLSFVTWIIRSYMLDIPKELEEAAMIDGCSKAGAFWRITFPLMAPGLVATGVFGFIQAWNEFLLALVVNSRPDMMTLPVWLRTFQKATETTNWAAIMAG